MARRSLILIVIGAVVVLAVGAFVLQRADLLPFSDGTSAATAQMRDALLSSPQDVRLNLAVDIPKGSESDNPDHQEIDATGVVDLAAGTGEMTYDFNELNNSAGFLGHFDVMDMVLGDGSIYIDVFVDGPPWLRIVPEDIGTGDVDRLRDMLLTNPLTLPAYLEVDARDEETSEEDTTRAISPASLASAEEPFAAAVGATLDEWRVTEVEVEISGGDAGPEAVVLSFSYAPQDAGKKIDVVATYELTQQDASPEVAIPADDDVREYAGIFGGT